jgi:putative ABC transport system substrate-binding protein
MRRTARGLALCAVLLALCVRAQAQQPTKVRRIGYLSPRHKIEPLESLFRQDLADLGYVEGRNIVIEWRLAEENFERFPELAADLVRQKVDTIVAIGIQGALAAKKATQIIPIVFATAYDPVESGLVPSLAQPSGNVTGVTDIAQLLAAKRVELLKHTIPRLSRVAVIVWSPAGPGHAAERKEIESAARELGIQLQPVNVRGRDDLEAGFSMMNKASANAFVGLTDGRFAGNRDRIVELSVKKRLPGAYPDREFVEAGGLMSYATNRTEWRRRIVSYVDRILKGAKPANLPVEQPTKFELVINLKTAKQIGVTIPPNVLARADKVIK